MQLGGTGASAQTFKSRWPSWHMQSIGLDDAHIVQTLPLLQDSAGAMTLLMHPALTRTGATVFPRRCSYLDVWLEPQHLVVAHGVQHHRHCCSYPPAAAGIVAAVIAVCAARAACQPAQRTPAAEQAHVRTATALLLVRTAAM